MTDAIQPFLAAMQSRDLALADGKNLIDDSQWHRCTATNKGGRNNDGAYKLCLDGPVPWGLYRNWTDGGDVAYWRGDLGRPLTDAEHQELERRVAHQRREHEKEAAELADEARQEAQRIWGRANDASADHPYLKRKRVKPHGLRVNSDQLLVPMYDPKGALVNLQLIDGHGQKWFLKGGRAKGCYFQIDGKLGPIVVAEGFATAASINEATGYYVVVAFNASNMTPVATMARQAMNNIDSNIWRAHKKVADEGGLEHERRPTFFNAKLIIAADDDWKTKDNPGIMAALQAARDSRALVANPKFDKNRKDSHTDFNDVAVLYDGKAVTDDIADAVEPQQLMEELLLADPHSAFGRAWIKELAALKQSDLARYEQLLAALKKAKARVGTLDREVKATIAAAAKAAAKSTADKTPVTVDIDALAASAENIIACENILDRFSNECRKVIAGESTLTKLLYLGGSYTMQCTWPSRGLPLLASQKPAVAYWSFSRRRRSSRLQLCRKKPCSTSRMILRTRYCRWAKPSVRMKRSSRIIFCGNC